eukprot:TRINITY_DN8229_c0_g1_i1.p1 TRINITY_DN8229_c0_g1~~TRINITY_DN8229_c0_g1_i1.p1  ORF type:complete len:307 (+),score=43.73 TRINITY_DN8229_c0_g1_i1:53-973(+)
MSGVIDFRRLYADTKRKITSSNVESNITSEIDIVSPAKDAQLLEQSISALPDDSSANHRETINIIDMIGVNGGSDKLERVGRETDRFPLPQMLHWAKIGGNAVQSLYYLPNYISEEEESDLISKIYASPDASSWKELRGRRVLSYGGQPLPEGMEQQPLPEWLIKISSQLNEDGILPLPANHVLINEYAPGQGIMPHKDGPLYFPRVAIVSLGSGLVMHFRKNPGDAPQFSIYLEPRSLLIFQDDCFEHLFHGIDAVTEDDLSSEKLLWPDAEDVDGQMPTRKIVQRQLRLSLTLRIVPKIVKKVN